MKHHYMILPTLPNLSDDAAYYFCNFFYEVAAELENHYAREIKSYCKKAESGYCRSDIPDTCEQGDAVLIDEEF